MPKEIASVCYSFSVAGIRQDDILNQSVDRIQAIAESTENNEKFKTSFNRLIVPMIRAFVDLNLHNAEGSLFSKLISDEFIAATTMGGNGLIEQVKRNYTEHGSLLISILRGRLDE